MSPTVIGHKQFLEAIRRDMVRPTLRGQACQGGTVGCADLYSLSTACRDWLGSLWAQRCERTRSPTEANPRCDAMRCDAMRCDAMRAIDSAGGLCGTQVDAQEKMARVAPHMTVAEAATVMAGLKASGTLVMEHDRLVRHGVLRRMAAPHHVCANAIE